MVWEAKGEFAGMNSLDKFFVNAEYCFRFSFCRIDKL